MQNKRKKIFIMLPLIKKEKLYYGTIKTTYAHIPVLAEITGKNFKYDIDGKINSTYIVLPYIEQTKTGKLIYMDETNSQGIKEKEISELGYYDTLQDCLHSCDYANSFCLKIISNTTSKSEEELAIELNKLKQVQDKQISDALEYIKSVFITNNEHEEEKGL